MYSSPRAQCVITPTRFDCVPEGTYIEASKPSISATSASSALMLGSSPKTSSPTGASAIAARIAAVGRVTVSLRKSVAMVCLVSCFDRSGYKNLRFALELREQDHVADRRRVGEQHHEPVDSDALARRRRQSVFHR